MENRKNLVVVGLGEVLYDHDVRNGSKGRGSKKVVFDPDCFKFGGAPANFADHFLKCAALFPEMVTAEVHVVSAVGVDADGKPDELGGRIIAELDGRKLHYHLTHVTGSSSGLVDKTKDASGGNRYKIYPAAWDAIDWTEELEQLARRTDVVCFGSLAQRRKTSRKTIRKFLDAMIATGRETLRVFDVNVRGKVTRKVLLDSIARCNILKISDEESAAVLEALTGYNVERAAGSVGQALLDKFTKLDMVILTEGAEGSRIFLRGNRVSGYVIPQKDRKKAFDTVGAGDSFTAAFCTMYLLEDDVWKAQSFASKVAEHVCSVASATPDYPETAREKFIVAD